jgi:hypothetical protein
MLAPGGTTLLPAERNTWARLLPEARRAAETVCVREAVELAMRVTGTQLAA